jgi:hypothetical protein
VRFRAESTACGGADGTVVSTRRHCALDVTGM